MIYPNTKEHVRDYAIRFGDVFSDRKIAARTLSNITETLHSNGEFSTLPVKDQIRHVKWVARTALEYRKVNQDLIILNSLANICMVKDGEELKIGRTQHLHRAIKRFEQKKGYLPRFSKGSFTKMAKQHIIDTHTSEKPKDWSMHNFKIAAKTYRQYDERYWLLAE